MNEEWEQHLKDTSWTIDEFGGRHCPKCTTIHGEDVCPKCGYFPPLDDPTDDKPYVPAGEDTSKTDRQIWREAADENRLQSKQAFSHVCVTSVDAHHVDGFHVERKMFRGEGKDCYRQAFKWYANESKAAYRWVENVYGIIAGFPDYISFTEAWCRYLLSITFVLRDSTNTLRDVYEARSKLACIRPLSPLIPEAREQAARMLARQEANQPAITDPSRADLLRMSGVIYPDAPDVGYRQSEMDHVYEEDDIDSEGE